MLKNTWRKIILANMKNKKSIRRGSARGREKFTKASRQCSKKNQPGTKEFGACMSKKLSKKNKKRSKK